VDVEHDLHREFKIGCAAQSTTIKAEVVAFIEGRLREWG